MPFMPITQARISSFGYENTHVTSGIFHDPFPAVSKALKTIGVVLEPSKQPPNTQDEAPKVTLPMQVRLDSSFFLDSNPWTAFTNYASFAEVKLLRMQKIDRRCTGLLGEFWDDQLPRILGQWDPSKTDAISMLHNSEIDGPLNTLTFVYSDVSQRAGYVTEIVPNRPGPERHHYQWENLNEVSKGFHRLP